MSEMYHFDFHGQELKVSIDLSKSPITDKTPNLRVLSGAWPSWHLDATKVGQGEIRIHRCAKILTPSTETLWALIIGDDGVIRRKRLGQATLEPFLNS